jgi:hypothetical protein
VAPAEGVMGGSAPTPPLAAGPLWGPQCPSVRAGVECPTIGTVLVFFTFLQHLT